MRDIVHASLAEGVEVLGNVSVGENSWKEEFERVKEEGDFLFKGVKSYKMEKGKFEKIQQGKEVALRAMTRSLVDLERI